MSTSIPFFKYTQKKLLLVLDVQGRREELGRGTTCHSARHTGDPRTSCHFRGLNSLLGESNCSTANAEGSDSVTMGRGQDSAGARLSVQAVASHQSGSAAHERTETAVMNWKLIIVEAKDVR